MIRRIYKYELQKTVTAVQEINVNLPATVLTFAIQNGVPCLWCLVNPEADQVLIRTQLKFTGQEFDHRLSMEYFASDSDIEVGLVYHCFVERNG
jgi:hypothetical protein